MDWKPGYVVSKTSKLTLSDSQNGSPELLTYLLWQIYWRVITPWCVERKISKYLLSFSAQRHQQYRHWNVFNYTCTQQRFKNSLYGPFCLVLIYLNKRKFRFNSTKLECLYRFMACIRSKVLLPFRDISGFSINQRFYQT